MCMHSASSAPRSAGQAMNWTVSEQVLVEVKRLRPYAETSVAFSADGAAPEAAQAAAGNPA